MSMRRRGRTCSYQVRLSTVVVGGEESKDCASSKGTASVIRGSAYLRKHAHRCAEHTGAWGAVGAFL